MRYFYWVGAAVLLGWQTAALAGGYPISGAWTVAPSNSRQIAVYGAPVRPVAEEKICQREHQPDDWSFSNPTHRRGTPRTGPASAGI